MLRCANALQRGICTHHCEDKCRILTHRFTRTFAGECCETAAAFEVWLTHAVRANSRVQLGCYGSKCEGRETGSDEQRGNDVEEAHWVVIRGLTGRVCKVSYANLYCRSFFSYAHACEVGFETEPVVTPKHTRLPSKCPIRLLKCSI